MKHYQHSKKVILTVLQIQEERPTDSTSPTPPLTLTYPTLLPLLPAMLTLSGSCSPSEYLSPNTRYHHIIFQDNLVDGIKPRVRLIAACDEQFAGREV